VIKDTQNEIISIVDPRILAVDINECFEPLIDIVGTSELIYGPSPEVPNNTDYTKMRKSVYEKLIEAQSNLPKNMRFCLYEAYRSLDVQSLIFNDYNSKIKSQYLNASEDEIWLRTTQLVSPLINRDGTKNIPPHSTGAAIDVYLIDVDSHEPFDMGIHPRDWMQDLTGEVSLTLSNVISSEEKRNRQIMSEALSNAGFINYPTEYWHWSYGDRYWAYFVGAKHAIYGNEF
jgi:zinc D-Ala-D-Ala dipeptidase